MAESVQATLKDIGMDVQINCTADNNTIRKDPYTVGCICKCHGNSTYRRCLSISSLPVVLILPVSNNGHYHSDKLEELAKQMENEFDVDKRSELGIQMQQTILADNAYVFCSHLRMSMIMQSNVTGLVAHPCDYYELTADLDIE